MSDSTPPRKVIPFSSDRPPYRRPRPSPEFVHAFGELHEIDRQVLEGLCLTLAQRSAQEEDR